MTLFQPRRNLFQRVYALENLTLSWRFVRAANGGPGVDGVTIAAFERDWETNLRALAQDLQQEVYTPAPLTHYRMPKANGSFRVITIATVRDRLAQRAVQRVIEPLFETRFLDCSYAYRPGRSTAQAAAAVLEARRQGFVWTVDADIAAFFDSLDQRLLLDEVALVVKDRAILRLIRLWLAMGLLETRSTVRPPRPQPPFRRDTVINGVNRVLDWGLLQLGGADGLAESDHAPDPRLEALRRTAKGAAFLALSSRGAIAGFSQRHLHRWRAANSAAIAGIALAGMAAAAAPLVQRRTQDTGGAGVAQGAVISPLLSNIYLHPLDVALTAHYPRVVRYADDLLILCRSRQEAEEALRALRAALARLQLQVREEKTSIHHVDEPFTFLGYRFIKGGAVPPEQQRAAVHTAQVKAQVTRYAADARRLAQAGTARIRTRAGSTGQHGMQER